MSDRSKPLTTLVLGKPVRYTVRRSRRARRMCLQVSPRVGLEVVLPQRWSMRDVQKAITDNAKWIDRKVDKLDVRDGPRSREMSSGSEILVFGRPRRLEMSAPAGKRPTVRLDEDRLIVELTPEDQLDPRPALRKWLRRIAGVHLRERVAALAVLHGFDPGRIFVGERSSRWGSCSSRGNLSFCYRLVMTPPEVIDAVVCHELSHLRHMNHGPGFKSLVASICPGHDQSMEWLKAHHEALEI